MQDQVVTQVPPEGKRGGKWITFGEEAYRVPPLSFRSIQELQDTVAKVAGMPMGGMPSGEQMDAVVTIVHAAIARNYPSLSKDAVAEMVDVENCGEVLQAVFNIAGFKQREPGDESGEAQASTGAGSTSP